ncbi:MAG: RNA-binding domain-containing protein [Sulfolobales archaeon]
MRLRVEAEVRPTEDLEKVRKAILNIFNIEGFRVVDAGEYRVLVGESGSITSLLKLREMIVRGKIADTARRIIAKNSSEKYVSFKINKQAAFAGKLSFVEDDRESSLGPINVFIEARDSKELIDWLAPNTHEKAMMEMPRDL